MAGICDIENDIYLKAEAGFIENLCSYITRFRKFQKGILDICFRVRRGEYFFKFFMMDRLAILKLF